MNALHPSAHVLIRLYISQIERYNDPIGLTIELVCKISESVLTGCVPQFDTDFRAIWSLVVGLDEVDTDSSNVLGLELTLVEPL